MHVVSVSRRTFGTPMCAPRLSEQLVLVITGYSNSINSPTLAAIVHRCDVTEIKGLLTGPWREQGQMAGHKPYRMVVPCLPTILLPCTRNLPCSKAPCAHASDCRQELGIEQQRQEGWGMVSLGERLAVAGPVVVAMSSQSSPSR